MYDYINGTITNVLPNSITLECNNIGYLIKTPNPYSFKLYEEKTIFIYQYVREDLIDLYGFSSIDERTMFLKLINVKGLGPKGALAILASSTVSEIIMAVEDGDPQYFKKFPGIGTKGSQQIILDLKGKLDFNKEATNNAEELKNLSNALKALGYSSSEIKSVTKDFKINDYPDLGSAVKAVLKMLTK